MSWLSKLNARPKGGTGTGTATVTRERPSTPPRILIGSHAYQPEEIVLSSFRIRPYEGDLIAKQNFDFKMAFQLDGEPVEFHCFGHVVRLDEQAGLVARYEQPQPFYARKLLEYMRLWKGV